MLRACCSKTAATRLLGSLLLTCWLLPAAAEEALCSCLWEGSFSDVQHKADLVVAGSVVAGKGNSVDLSVERILRGREYAGTVRVWLKARDYCRPEVEAFPAGSHWVMALYRIEEDVAGGFDPGTPNISYGRIGDYRLSSCGGYWLAREGDWVTGNLAGAPRWVREPKMTPVLLDLVADFVAGEVPASALAEAAREDPALRELRLDTRAFLRQAE